jgi:hypothetical protein
MLRFPLFPQRNRVVYILCGALKCITTGGVSAVKEVANKKQGGLTQVANRQILRTGGLAKEV